MVMLDFVTGIKNTMKVLKVNLTIGSKTLSIIVLWNDKLQRCTWARLDTH